MEEILVQYLTYFKKLNRGYNKGLGKAPHKPILLISILQLIEKGVISNNRIYITPELLLAFKDNWLKLVETQHISNFALPFFHLRSEPFWNLVSKNGMDIQLTKSKSIKSFNNLKESIAFAEMDQKLFFLAQVPNYKVVLENFLLDEYFNNSKVNYSANDTYSLEYKISDELLNDDSQNYAHKIGELQRKLNEEQFEEEIFVRGGLLV